MLNQLEERFKERSNKAHFLIPSHLNLMIDAYFGDIKAACECDIPSPSTINQKLRLWTLHWDNEDKPVNVRDTLKQLSSHGLSKKLYPNIVVILMVLLTIPATSASVQRANSALKFVNNVYRSKMSENRLNSLILIYSQSC